MQPGPPSTPSHQVSSPSTPSHKPIQPAQAPRPRRNISDRGTPRSSKLQEVFSAGDHDDDESTVDGSEDGEAEEKESERMDVDEQK